MHLQENTSLKSLNSFGLDVTTRYLTTFTSVAELRQCLEMPLVKQGPMMVLGGGSNVLFTQNFSGVILLNRIKGIDIVSEDEQSVLVKAASGEVWHDLVMYAVAKGWGGIENLSLIPGCVGAAPVQNIGAYGVEIKDVAVEIFAVEISTGKEVIFKNKDCHFGYRTSVFKTSLKSQYIITGVSFRLSKDPKVNVSYGAITSVLNEMGVSNPTIADVSKAVIQIRSSKLPDPAVIGNAGSFFKNPEIPESVFQKLQFEYPAVPKFPGAEGGIKVPAGWLIEQCGWKGKRVGNTGSHKDQALVLLNYGNAQGNEIKALALDIIESVKQKFGIELEAEVNIV